MLRLAALVWMMLATALAGIALLVVLTVPSLAVDARQLLPIACGAAVVAAMPLSYLVAWRISRATVA
jgi:hypothetical protein